MPRLPLGPLRRDGSDLIIRVVCRARGIERLAKSKINPLSTAFPIGLPFLLVLRRKSGCSPVMINGVAALTTRVPLALLAA